MNTKGEHVTMVPLVRGDNDERGTLAYVIWLAIEQAGDWDKIFWEIEPQPGKGDLFHWCRYLTDANTVLTMFFDDNNALAGIIWFNTYNEAEQSAHIHVWVEPGHRGPATREMGLMATYYAHKVLKLKKIIGISPYWVIRNFGLKCGYKEVERGEYIINGEMRTLFRVEKEFSDG